MTPLKPVTKSSRIASYGYDAASQVFSVMFHKNTKRFDYPDTPPEKAKAFDDAESKGTAFSQLFQKSPYVPVETAASDATTDAPADAEA